MTRHVKMAPYKAIDNPDTRRIELVKRLELIQTNQRRKRNRARKVATFGCDRKVVLLKEAELKKDVIYIRIVMCDVEQDAEDKVGCYMYFDARYSDPNQHYDDKKDRWYVYCDARYSARLFKPNTKVQFVDSINRWMPVPPHHWWYGR